MNHRTTILAVALAGACLLSVATSAAVAAPPRGYTVVTSPTLPAANGQQTRGTATCPAGLVPLGGGAFIHSASGGANVNSSFPTPTGWAADVNNATGAATDFEVRVVCAKQPRLYTVVRSDPASNPAGTQEGALATCPKGTKPLGGGGLSNAGLVLVNLNSTTLNGRSWLVIENNASTFPATVTAFAICGKLPGYTVVTGTDTLNPPGSRTFSQVSCPSGTLPIGGGVFSTSFSLAVNVNTSVPSGGEWSSFENNAGPTPGFTSTTAICAGK